jgi:hypothetical protein
MPSRALEGRNLVFEIVLGVLTYCKTNRGVPRVMGGRTCAIRVWLVALAAGFMTCGAPRAFAGDASYCVTCKNPDQTYVCRVTGEDTRPSDALKLYCVIRTAKEGNHASCSAERSDAGCRGIEKVYSYDGPSIPEDLASDPRVQNSAEKVDREQRGFEKPKRQAPQTLVELTGRAASATRQGWRNTRERFGGSSDGQQPLPVQPQSTSGTGAAAAAQSAEAPRASKARRASSAVGGFARKSYRCLRSLFRHCSEDTASGQPIQQ